MRVFGPLTRCFGALALATVTTSAAAPRLDPAFGRAGVVTTDFGSPVEIGALLPKRDGSIFVVGTDTNLGDVLVLRYTADSILRVNASFDVHEGLDYVDTVAEQADGTLLVAGRTCDLLDPARTCAAFVARLGVDGRLDPGFGLGGIAVGSMTSGIARGVRALALADDGGFVAAVVETAGVAGSGSLLLLRYEVDGSLDPSFGAAGIVRTGVIVDQNVAVVVQPDGRVVAGAGTAVLRYLADGSPDPTWGSAGSAASGVPARALLLEPDGTLLVGGDLVTATGSDLALTRLDTGGATDPSFGVAGVATTDYGGGYDVLHGLARMPDGPIIAVGTGVGGGGAATAVFASYTSSGDPDTTFSPSGVVAVAPSNIIDHPAVAVDAAGLVIAYNALPVTGIRYVGREFFVAFGGEAGDPAQIRLSSSRSSVDVAYAVAVRADGSIVTAGGYGYIALAAHTSAGRLDRSFSDDGRAVFAVGTPYGEAARTLIASEGRLIVGGTWDKKIALVSLQPDGNLDPTFGDGGVAEGKLLSPGAGGAQSLDRTQIHPASCSPVCRYPDDYFTRAVLRPDGRIVALAYEGGRILLERFTPDGRYDAAFPGDSLSRLLGKGSGLVLQGDCSLVVGGGYAGGSFLVRVTGDGVFDTSFGVDGIAATPINVVNVIRQCDGRVVVLGSTAGTTAGHYKDLAVARHRDDGSLDPTFGRDGVATLSLPHELTPDGRSAGDTVAVIAADALVRADGTIVVVGTRTTSTAHGGPVLNSIVVARYDQTGTLLDVTIGPAGGAVAAASAPRTPPGATSPGGAFIVAGTADDDFLLARFLDDSGPQTCPVETCDDDAPAGGCAALDGFVRARCLLAVLAAPCGDEQLRPRVARRLTRGRERTEALLAEAEARPAKASRLLRKAMRRVRRLRHAVRAMKKRPSAECRTHVLGLLDDLAPVLRTLGG